MKEKQNKSERSSFAPILREHPTSGGAFLPNALTADAIGAKECDEPQKEFALPRGPRRTIEQDKNQGVPKKRPTEYLEAGAEPTAPIPRQYPTPGGAFLRNALTADAIGANECYEPKK